MDCYEIRSAGLSTNTGKQSDPTAARVAKRRGILLDDHRTTALERSIVDAAGMICLMDKSHYSNFGRKYPDAMSKTIYLGSLGLRDGAPLIINDPYGKSEEQFDRCFDAIDAAIIRLAECLRSGTVR
jgi:protein-tyrosine phosphatase